MKKILFVILTLSLFCFEHQLPAQSKLQALINATPAQPSPIPERIQPRSLMKLSATIKNVGDQANTPGTLMVKFAFANPLHTHPKSLLFETEKVNLPSIEPGQEITLSFSKMHRWPTLFDYIRDDWAMREYRAIVNVERIEKMIGTRAIAFSAYYYEGHSRPRAVDVP